MKKTTQKLVFLALWLLVNGHHEDDSSKPAPPSHNVPIPELEETPSSSSLFPKTEMIRSRRYLEMAPPAPYYSANSPPFYNPQSFTNQYSNQYYNYYRPPAPQYTIPHNYPPVQQTPQLPAYQGQGYVSRTIYTAPPVANRAYNPPPAISYSSETFPQHQSQPPPPMPMYNMPNYLPPYPQPQQNYYQQVPYPTTYGTIPTYSPVFPPAMPINYGNGYNQLAPPYHQYQYNQHLNHQKYGQPDHFTFPYEFPVREEFNRKPEEDFNKGNDKEFNKEKDTSVTSGGKFSKLDINLDD